MKSQQLIPTKTLCSLYNIEISFVDALNQMGLIQIQIIERKKFIHQDEISNLEKIIRLHNELNVNLEGIDVVFNLLEKERILRNELNALRNRLRLYEQD
ncbi:MAG: MerR family transcriptional regulator [Bacteroidetes bacterium]|nr:MerR family transcriptional regulator [Bacteroidota bacterium]MBP7398940.1 MerR family transcriptional regulator [Chitinophagales bacterium]MBK7110180.1 MerR family transcriptional regulator [Bacteroidota bacterium]MBK8487087.1 MerR family transcriptional regulator [Bacteroidota bacterium]MBK8680476.1 MerR family transcriptional regulator [Bacteroidota bacterium]